MMKLIIEISEDVYEECQGHIYFPDTGGELFNAVKNGTPLPKGHGRLIDADSIYQIVRPIEQSDAEWGMTAETAKRLMFDAFDKAPTIIEADEGGEEV